MLWAGLYVSSSSVFRGTQYMSVISPLFIYLLISRLSGGGRLNLEIVPLQVLLGYPLEIPCFECHV